MPDSTTPNRPSQSFRALDRERQLEAQQAQAARFRARLLNAANVDPESLSPQAQRTLRWLTEWDDPTIAGLVEILQATRRVDVTSQVRHVRRRLDGGEGIGR